MIDQERDKTVLAELMRLSLKLIVVAGELHALTLRFSERPAKDGKDDQKIEVAK